MRYLPCYKQIGISQDRYLQMLHFCRQYPEWIEKIQSLSTEKDKEKLIRKINLVENTAFEVENGEWCKALILNICYKKAFNKIDTAFLPSSKNNTYFKKRREFFEILERKFE